MNVITMLRYFSSVFYGKEIWRVSNSGVLRANSAQDGGLTGQAYRNPRKCAPSSVGARAAVAVFAGELGEQA